MASIRDLKRVLKQVNSVVDRMDEITLSVKTAHVRAKKLPEEVKGIILSLDEVADNTAKQALAVADKVSEIIEIEETLKDDSPIES